VTNSEPSAVATPADVQKTLEKVEYQGRRQGPRLALLISLLCFLWSVYQLWIASPLPFMFDFAIIGDVPARGIHLSFALLLCFLMYPMTRRWSERGTGKMQSSNRSSVDSRAFSSTTSVCSALTRLMAVSVRSRIIDSTSRPT